MKRIIRFTASWCNPCKALAKNLEEAESYENSERFIWAKILAKEWYFSSLLI